MTRKGFSTSSKVRITSQDSDLPARSLCHPVSWTTPDLISCILPNPVSIDNVKNHYPFYLQVFKANKDSDSVVTNRLEVPILARFVRINPLAWNQLGSICLRLELYGCQTNQGNKKTWMKKLTEKEKKKKGRKELSESFIMTNGFDSVETRLPSFKL